MQFFLEQSPIFYVKIFFIILCVILTIVILSKIFSIISSRHQVSKFNKKQEKIKRNKRNIAELNKRSGINGRISSAAFTNTVDIEDIRENNNVELRTKRVSRKDLLD